MGYRYIAILRGAEASTQGSVLQMEELLRTRAIERRHTIGPLELFVGNETPTLQLSGDTILLGHVFSRDGTPLSGSAAMSSLPQGEPLRHHLLENFWGEYMLIQLFSGIRRYLTVTRDPSAGVPCIYSISDGGGFVTSDISIATELNLYRRQIDWDYIARCLLFPYQKAQRTGLVGINELLPGCSLRISSNETTTEQDWSPWKFVDPRFRQNDPAEAAAEVRRAVSTAVEAWAALDQSILLEMSGGLDSSIVAACLINTQARITCCTVVTPVPGADERHYAQLIADYLGVDLDAQMLGFDDAQISFVPTLSTASPRIGILHSAIDKLMTAAADHHGTGSFYTGAGGDTVFCYLTNASPAADAFREGGLGAGISAIRNLSSLHECTLWTAARLAIRKLVSAPKPPSTARRTFVHPSRVSGALEDHPWFLAPPNALPGDRERISGLVATQVYRDIAPRGVKRWLRMPLLAQPVVEACLRVPSFMWIAEGQNRAIARSAFASALPAEILTRRSKGNFVSYLGGIYRRNRQHIRELLLGGHMHEHRFLNSSALCHFLDQEDLPTRDELFIDILDLCMIENWLRQNS